MSSALEYTAALLLCTIAPSLWRVLRGPSQADRMVGAQISTTGGMAVLMLLSVATGNAAVLDVALVLALLSAFAAVAMVKAASRDGAGDPEDDGPEL
jgi:multicomponent Na+:H+ antiporter subunit F